MRIGEDKFKKLPKLGAELYNRLLQIKPVKLQVEQTAQDLISRISEGRLLDVGTGPGRLLFAIHRINPDIVLFGQDLSASMIQLAKRNLSGIKVDLRQENIKQTSYDSNYFDLVTSTGSLYLWDHPEEGIEEIYRILKEDRSAFLYEPYKDFDLDKFSSAFKSNLQQVNILMRLIGPLLMRKITRTAYRIDEYIDIIKQTSFADSFGIDRMVLGNLPIWLRIELKKLTSTNRLTLTSLTNTI
jgi:ubiquinone/menaquinone biosynthesis C-methylase UbiE